MFFSTAWSLDGLRLVSQPLASPLISSVEPLCAPLLNHDLQQVEHQS